MLALAVATTRFAKAAGPSFEVFAMDNGVGRGIWSPERQASALREIGFGGISYDYTNPADLKAWLAELSKRNLRLYGIYFGAQLQGEKPLPDGIEEAVQLLHGTDAVLWLTIGSPGHPGDYEAQALKRVQEVADLAAGARLRVVLYPHFNLYVATAEHAFDLAVRSGRANVGVTLNLCHELAAGNGGRIPDIIRRVAPSLAMVTICGASDKPGPGWDNYIKRLGDGDYDVAGVLRTLADVDYLGPVGIQFYGLKGDQRETLESTMHAWRALTATARAP
ncbi:MAG TPA: TIM barrel protein [Opitutaceae bacterium]|nr:TIM barrel protein [Opitutaceae bacterium]